MGSIPPSLLSEKENFSCPPTTHTFSALLFDMDGTIIDSTAAITAHWLSLGREIGIPGSEILKTSHGRRSIDVLAEICPSRANWEYISRIEGEIPRVYGGKEETRAVEICGAREILGKLEEVKAPWAIVTSGTRGLVDGWLGVLGLARPRVMVTAEAVRKGKPDPECYCMGAEMLAVKKEGEGKGEVLVLEDAPAGVRSGKAAGSKVVAVATTHGVEKLREAGADWIVRDLRSIRFIGYEGGKVKVEIWDALV